MRDGAWGGGGLNALAVPDSVEVGGRRLERAGGARQRGGQARRRLERAAAAEGEGDGRVAGASAIRSRVCFSNANMTRKRSCSEQRDGAMRTGGLPTTMVATASATTIAGSTTAHAAREGPSDRLLAHVSASEPEGAAAHRGRRACREVFAARSEDLALASRRVRADRRRRYSPSSRRLRRPWRTHASRKDAWPHIADEYFVGRFTTIRSASSGMRWATSL